MDNESQDFSLTQEQKSRLLSLGLNSGSHEMDKDEAEQKTDILYEILYSSLPVDPSVVNSLPPVVKGLSSKLRSLAGHTIGELLQNPKTDISTLRKIKNYAKDSGTSSNSEVENDVFLVVYYAAIASAVVFNHKKITQHSYKDLEQYFSSFTQKDWVLDEIKGLFHGAQKHCRRIAKVADNPGE